MFRFFQLFIVLDNSQVEYRQINADIILSHNLLYRYNGHGR